MDLLSTDATLVNSVISKAGASLALVEHELSRLRDQVKQLEEKRASLLTHLAKNTAILSPLRRMPPEVLGEIFAWTLPSVDALMREGFVVENSPWVLTHVSSHWRAVALSTPFLWSLVVVNFTGESPSPLNMVNAQIQRAQALKIHLRGDQESDSRPQIELFRCLAEHSARWLELSIWLTSDLVPLLTSLRNRLTSLCRLSIQWSGPESQAGVELIDGFQSAPSLVDVAIYNQYRYVPTLLPAHQLTRYDIDGPWEMHRGILTLAPNLVQARVYINFSDGNWPESGEIIHLLRLQRLFVSYQDILNYLKAPVLQEIVFEVDEEEHPRYLPHLDPFMSRSGCTLRKLSFHRSPTSHAAAEVLRKYPSVTELAIIHDSAARARDFLSYLTFPNSTGSAAISPQLSEISFAFLPPSHIDHTLYLDMLKSRWKAKDCALQSAALLTVSETGPNSATLCGLDVLRGEGMDILLLQGTEASKVMFDWTYGSTWVY